MRRIIFCIVLLSLPLFVLSQKAPVVRVAKDGAVNVNGKKAFYMISKSVVPWESDYAVENLQHKELAYLKLAKGFKYTSNTNSHAEVLYYVLTFDNGGAHCDVRDYMDYDKTIIGALATVLVRAGVIKNGAIDEVAEKKFVEKNKGFMTPAKETDTTSKYLTSAIEHSDSDSLNGHITMKEGFIYYEQTIIGTFKKIDIDTDLSLVQVFSVNKNKVAEATYIKGDDHWKIVTIVDEKRSTLPYDKDSAMQELFRHLLRKRYL